MAVIYPRGCGLDIPHKTVVACLLPREAGPPPVQTRRPLRPMTAHRRTLAAWLPTAGGTHVAMAWAGASWRPLSNRLEGLWTLRVVKAQQMKAVPGRPTEGKDAAWLAELRRHGRWRGSCSPAQTQRQRRELPRHRTALGHDRARVRTRVPRVVEDATITLAAGVTEIRGVSARARLAARIAGHRDGAALAEVARGRLRTTRDQLTAAGRGDFTPHHSFLVTEDLRPLDARDEALDRVRAAIAPHRVVAQEAVARLKTIPGVSPRTAESRRADIGTDLTRFPTARQLAAGAGMSPGHDDRGGTRLGGKTRQGHRWRRHACVAVAQVASPMKQTSLAAPSRRLAARRGQKRARIAGGHTILRRVSTVLTR